MNGFYFKITDEQIFQTFIYHATWWTVLVAMGFNTAAASIKQFENTLRKALLRG